jgi:hypothetical protein
MYRQDTKTPGRTKKQLSADFAEDADFEIQIGDIGVIGSLSPFLVCLRISADSREMPLRSGG